MKHPVLRYLLAVLGLAAGGSAVAQVTRPDSAALNPGQDPRLAQPVCVRAEGIPVRWVLEALSQKTSVRLDVTGTAGDERLVAFVPERPLAEVMAAIADLYRLTWTHEARGGRHRYLLQKPPRLANEERALREQAFRQVMQRLAAQLRTSLRSGEGVLPGENSWAAVLPFVAPVVETRVADLLRDGLLYVPITSLPDAQREPLLANLQSALDREHRVTKLLAERTREQRQAEGKDPVYLAGEDGPASPRNCTLMVELLADEELRAGVGLKTGTGTSHYLAHASSTGTLAKALKLYRDRSPDLPEPAGRPMRREIRPLGDRWTRPVQLARDHAAASGDWIGSLRRLSEASGIALYADCYQDLREGPERHPRADLALTGRVVPYDALGTACYPVSKRGDEPLTANSFWWRRGDSALLRSRRWLWESAAVLPASLLDRITRSLRAEGRLRPDDVTAIAALTPFQVRGAGFLEGHWDTWRASVNVPAGLSPGARRMLLGDGLTWERLGPADRAALPRLLPFAGVPYEKYAARLESSIVSIPAQGGTMARVRFQAAGPVRTESSVLLLPLPGVSSGVDLPTGGLRIDIPDGSPLDPGW